MNLPIPDDYTYLDHTIVVPAAGVIVDVDVEIVDLRHPADDYLEISLRGPDGTEIELSFYNGDGADFIHTVFDDEADTDIWDGVPPFTGRFRPEDPLSIFDGLDQQGDWTLRIRDEGSGYIGVLNQWAVIITVLESCSTSTFQRVVIANDGSLGAVTFLGNAQVNGDMAVQANARLEMGTKDLIVGGALSNSGDIRQTKVVNAAADVGFFATGGYGGVLLNANGLDLGSTTVSIRGNQDCTAVAGETVRRCFDLAPANATGRNATVTFFFAGSEIPPGQSCAALNAYRWDGSRWAGLALDPGYGTAGRTCGGDPQSVRVQNVAAFSRFVLRAGGPAAPLVAIGRDASGDTELSWTHDPANSGGYEVWWSNAPFFAPGDAGAQKATLPAPTHTFTHTGVAGQNLYYLALGLQGAAWASSHSNRTGRFWFTLTPGTP